MPIKSILSPAANTLLLAIFNCCKIEVAEYREAGNFDSRRLGSDYEFRNTTLSELILARGFDPATPKVALNSFGNSLYELNQKRYIKIQNETLWRRCRGQNTLQAFVKASQEFGKQSGQEVDPYLDQKFQAFLAERYPQLAQTKIYITNNGVLYSRRRVTARMKGAPLPMPKPPFTPV
jgi:hypothetical protein